MSAMMTLARAAGWIPGAVLAGDVATSVLRVHTDTRSIEAGDLFVALQGERFDANTMLHQARALGAAAVVCHAGLPPEAYPAGLPRIEVADTRRALADLASGWRAQFDLPLIAVTGSNGKTTVTQMIASILHAHAPDGAALATLGNFNNDIGVPLTLLRLRTQHRIAVVELGMNHPGEIAVLAAIARPTVALVNNAQREHLEFMRTIEAVARENGSVLAALPATGRAVFPGDDAYAELWSALCPGRPVMRFAANPAGADVTLQSAQWADGAWQVHASTPLGALRYRLAIAGRHNVKNSLAAAACALAAGVPPDTVIQGLEAFEPVKGRCRALQVRHGALDFTLVDDTYNANPDSMRAAIDVLADLPAPRMLILGDMGEVGEQGPAFHAEAGCYALQAGIDHLLALGEASAHAVQQLPGARHFADVQSLIDAARELAPSVASVLVKGSRFMRMERVVEALSAAPAAGEKT
ncbi:UDP-N-acetylmuramoyl-tripeptide--D-alanyl-D-alanine ligase [Rhodoferax sp. OV413]|uniref:UDP-N-acetylmuramoyl-tripeptide--D-alanyl-D- alanine ligase n=1 Tax=Rhodoferax sp. OV413 TaxID=1855285 RepID=UPI0025F75163|nr:UDP-N-acetylmuramoyl-tripeptide--D-alanyl-D-alanine ligase [Rhodoferax sp. OV413]